MSHRIHISLTLPFTQAEGWWEGFSNVYPSISFGSPLYSCVTDKTNLQALHTPSGTVHSALLLEPSDSAGGPGGWGCLLIVLFQPVSGRCSVPGYWKCRFLCDSAPPPVLQETSDEPASAWDYRVCFYSFTSQAMDLHLMLRGQELGEV